MKGVLERIQRKKLVAISRKVYGEDLLRAAQSVREGGIELLEVTFDQSDSEGIDKTAQAISLIKHELGSDLCVGAGTVMTCAQAQAARDAGADFALSPNVDLEVIAELKRLNVLSIPGAFTPSEVVDAYNAGGSIIKLFPAAMLGCEFIKAMRAPISHIPLMAVGGISHHNVVSFLQSGCMSAGIGSQIIDATRIKQQGQAAFAEIKAASSEFCALLQNLD